MKVHSTNYFDTFIEIAEDCSAIQAEIPPIKGDNKTVANLQFDIIHKNPYKYTSDDVLFQVFAIKKEIIEDELLEAKKLFFAKGQACFRASPLTQRYGWGLHSDAEGKIALIGEGSIEYEKLKNTPELKILKAMRSKR